MRFDDYLGLEHSDAETFFFRRAERSEKRLLHELPAHPTAIVGDDKLSPAIPVARLYSHQSLVPDRIGSVQEQVHDHALELLSISGKTWDGLKIFHPLRAGIAVHLRDSLSEQGIEI